MKRILSILLVLMMVFTSFAFADDAGTNTTTATPKYNYHLDIVVWVIQQTNGTWATATLYDGTKIPNVSYGSNQIYKTSIDSNHNWKVTNIMTVKDAEAKGISIDDCTNNMPEYAEGPKYVYDLLYSPHVATTISGLKITSKEGENLKFSAIVKLDSPLPYDMIQAYIGCSDIISMIF